MRLLASLLVLAACVSPAPAAGSSLARAPVEDVGLAFWCDWDKRCHRDDTTRLPVGRVDDKVWRAALRFSLEGLPARAAITSARLERYLDGTCVVPRRRVGPCLVGDLTSLVSDWAPGVVPKRGVLLELAGGWEDFGTSGPYFASSSSKSVSLRPRLARSYVVPVAGLSP